mgnify:CR=1 FL=1
MGLHSLQIVMNVIMKEHVIVYVVNLMYVEYVEEMPHVWIAMMKLMET